MPADAPRGYSAGPRDNSVALAPQTGRYRGRIDSRSIATRLAAPSQFDTYSLHITSGDDLSQDLLIEHLANAGYFRQEPVARPENFRFAAESSMCFRR